MHDIPHVSSSCCMHTLRHTIPWWSLTHASPEHSNMLSPSPPRQTAVHLAFSLRGLDCLMVGSYGVADSTGYWGWVGCCHPAVGCWPACQGTGAAPVQPADAAGSAASTAAASHAQCCATRPRWPYISCILICTYDMQ